MYGKPRSTPTRAQAASGLATPEDLGAALAAIGATCKGCHERYRE